MGLSCEKVPAVPRCPGHQPPARPRWHRVDGGNGGIPTGHRGQTVLSPPEVTSPAAAPQPAHLSSRKKTTVKRPARRQLREGGKRGTDRSRQRPGPAPPGPAPRPPPPRAARWRSKPGDGGGAVPGGGAGREGGRSAGAGGSVAGVKARHLPTPPCFASAPPWPAIPGTGGTGRRRRRR